MAATTQVMVIATLLRQKYLSVSGKWGLSIKPSTPSTSSKTWLFIRRSIWLSKWPPCRRHWLATPVSMVMTMWSNRPSYWPFQWVCYPWRQNDCDDRLRSTRWLSPLMIVMLCTVCNSHLGQVLLCEQMQPNPCPISQPGWCQCIQQRELEKRM